MDELVAAIMTGDTVLLLEGASKALSIPITGREQRNVEEPSSQMTIRGSREGRYLSASLFSLHYCC